MIYILYFVSIVAYIIIGYCVVLMDALTEGRLWPYINPIYTLLFWPFLLAYEIGRSLFIYLFKK